MAQLHKWFTTEQVKLILEWFDTGTITEAHACERLGVKRRRFFMLLARWREDRERFSIAYGRTTPNRRIDPGVERCIKQELEADKKLIDDPDIPIRHYNYSAIRDGVTETTGRSVSVNTVINRAKDWEYYIASPPKQPHDREVLTGAVGMLLQHDTSHHLWSPFAASKWALVTTIDDHSRKLLYGDFWEAETAWGPHRCRGNGHTPAWHRHGLLRRQSRYLPVRVPPGQYLGQSAAGDG